MSSSCKLIGTQSRLIERGFALVFDIDQDNFIQGFAVRYRGEVYCYRNQCPHTGSPLDWTAGEFFDEQGDFLICSTHGAIFDPASGRCLKGPCVNQSLIPIPLKFEGNNIFACL